MSDVKRPSPFIKLTGHRGEVIRVLPIHIVMLKGNVGQNCTVELSSGMSVAVHESPEQVEALMLDWLELPR
jgi:hypothetical protein